MSRIVIDSEYSITSDANQWILCKKAKPTKTNPSGWRHIKYYADLGALVKGLADMMLRESEYFSFKRLAENQSEIKDMLNKVLDT